MRKPPSYPRLIGSILTWSILVATSSGLRGDTYHTPLDQKVSGGISGRIAGASSLQTIIAIEPYEMKAYQGRVDAAAGSFTFHGLPPGEYDLLVKTVGHVYEGVSLDAGQDTFAQGKDLQAICDAVAEFFFKTEDYFNRKHIVRLTGSDEFARMLVVQTRTKKVLTPGGARINARIRRFDLLDVVKTRQVWQIVTSRHLLRQEVPYGSKDIDIELIYSPKLGHMLVGETIKDLGVLDVRKLPRAPKGTYASAKYNE